MKIERIFRYYGYDLMINNILHKKCLLCEKWYKFEGEFGYCPTCLEASINQGFHLTVDFTSIKE